MNVLEVELQMSLVSVNVARSILNRYILQSWKTQLNANLNESSAMYVLFSVDEENDPKFGPVLDHTHPLGISAETCLERATVFVEGGPGNVHTVHPFLINWGFHGYRYFYSRYRQNGRQDTVAALNVLSQAMEILGERWNLSGKWNLNYKHLKLLPALNWIELTNPRHHYRYIGMYMSLLNVDQII